MGDRLNTNAAETNLIKTINRRALYIPKRGMKIIDGMKAPKKEPMISRP